MLNKKIVLMLFVILFLSMSISFAIDNETQTELNNDNNILKEDISSNAPFHDDEKTFNDIQVAIDDADDGTVNLTDNFIGTGERIKVNENITIDGNQKTVLDGNNTVNGFNIDYGSDMIFLKGLTFKNFYNDIDGSTSNAIFEQNFNDKVANLSFIDCNFINNTGRFMYLRNAVISFSNCNFSNNILMEPIICNFKNCNFVNNNMRPIYPNGDPEYNCTNCNFTGNHEFHFNFMNVLNSNFNNNEKSKLSANLIKNCNFTNNNNKDTGMVVSHLIVNCYFENNHAKEGENRNGDYGAGQATSVINSTFISNRADGWGGAIMAINVENCTFIKNYAKKGGAIFFYNDVPQTMKNCIFINNTGYDGGAIYNDFGELSISNCNFIGNRVKAPGETMDGGGAISTRGILSVIDSVFENNFAKSSGSAIIVDAIMEKQYVTILNSKFTKNIAQGEIFTANYPFKSYGNGLIYILGANPCNIKIVNCTGIVKNTDKFKTKLSPTVKSPSVAYRNNIIINMKDSANNPYKNLKVAVKINGKSLPKTSDKNGQIKVKANLAPKTYTMTVSYAGSNFISKISKNFKITVKKATPKIIASAKTFKASLKTKKYTIALKCDDNSPVKNVKVTLKIEGKTFMAKTNPYGKATFKMVKVTKKGASKAVISFGGSNYFNKVSKTVKITMK